MLELRHDRAFLTGLIDRIGTPGDRDRESAPGNTTTINSTSVNRCVACRLRSCAGRYTLGLLSAVMPDPSLVAALRTQPNACLSRAAAENNRTGARGSPLRAGSPCPTYWSPNSAANGPQDWPFSSTKVKVSWSTFACADGGLTVSTCGSV